MHNDEQTVRVVTDDLFEILEIPNAADEQARVDGASAITREIRRRKLAPADAAKRLGISQAQLSAIMNAQIDDFSREQLDGMLKAL
ncbi:MAG TPA: XRE family transcriptional regulator [Longimicrobium sp.]